MPKDKVLETIEVEPLQKLFEGVEYHRKGMNVARSLAPWKVDEETFVRMRRLSLAKLVFASDKLLKVTELDTPATYLIELATPRERGSLLIYTAAWSNTYDDPAVAKLYEKWAGTMHGFPEEEYHLLGTSEEIFETYDQRLQEKPKRIQELGRIFCLAVSPSIYTEAGLTDLIQSVQH